MKKEFYVIQLGGVQHIVSPGEEITVNKVTGKVGDKVKIDKVLLHNNGDKVDIGTPFLSEKLEAEIVKQFKGKKLKMMTYKAKAHNRRRFGHRQLLTTVKIEGGNSSKKQEKSKSTKAKTTKGKATKKKSTQKSDKTKKKTSSTTSKKKNSKKKTSK